MLCRHGLVLFAKQLVNIILLTARIGLQYIAIAILGDVSFVSHVQGVYSIRYLLLNSQANKA